MHNSAVAHSSVLASLLLVRRCPVCRQRMWDGEVGLCARCASALPQLMHCSIDDNAMLRMLWGYVPVQHAQALMCYRHTSVYHQLLMRIKYEGDSQLTLRLGAWMGIEAHCTGMDRHIDVLVPVPLTPERERARGYNQALLLARGAASVLGVPVVQMLTRQSSGGSQTRLTAQARGSNATGAYCARVPQEYVGCRIVLVDDVMTTGATMVQCTAALLASDPTAQVGVLTLAFVGE